MEIVIIVIGAFIYIFVINNVNNFGLKALNPYYYGYYFGIYLKKNYHKISGE